MDINENLSKELNEILSNSKEIKLSNEEVYEFDNLIMKERHISLRVNKLEEERSALHKKGLELWRKIYIKYELDSKINYTFDIFKRSIRES